MKNFKIRVERQQFSFGLYVAFNSTGIIRYLDIFVPFVVVTMSWLKKTKPTKKARRRK